MSEEIIKQNENFNKFVPVEFGAEVYITGYFLPFINRVCFSYGKISIKLANSVRDDQGFNILPYEKKTEL